MACVNSPVQANFEQGRPTTGKDGMVSKSIALFAHTLMRLLMCEKMRDTPLNGRANAALLSKRLKVKRQKIGDS